MIARSYFVLSSIDERKRSLDLRLHRLFFADVILSSVSGRASLLFAPGWTAGAGIEHAFSSRVSAKIEYLYVQTYGQAHTYYEFENEEFRSDDTFTSNIIRVGLNYKF